VKPTAAMEDYLEALLTLEQKNIEPRVKNLAEELGIKPPSVIDMLKSLSEKKYVTRSTRTSIELTEDGRRIGEKIQRRHIFIQKFFTDVLGMNEALANEDACKVEHCLSTSTCNRFIEYTQYITEKQKTPTSWLQDRS